MRDFENLFAAFKSDASDSRTEGLVLLSVDTPLRIYYGLSAQRNPRLAFLSSAKPPEIASTKAIRVSSVQETDDTYWMFFDLLEQSASAVYFTLCDDLVAALESSCAKDEASAVMCLKNRFTAWRKMFRQERSSLSEEQVVGLLGELYFMDKFLIPEIGSARAVKAWSGIDGTSKDFSDGDRWYEVKAASLGANSVKISSLAQLSSDIPGALVVVRYETMSQGYDDGSSRMSRTDNACLIVTSRSRATDVLSRTRRRYLRRRIMTDDERKHFLDDAKEVALIHLKRRQPTHSDVVAKVRSCLEEFVPLTRQLARFCHTFRAKRILQKVDGDNRC